MVLCLILAIIVTFAQNLLGVGIVGALGADPRLGLCAGSIASSEVPVPQQLMAR